MRPPWELGKSLEELGYDRAFVRVYRALPKGRNAIRPKDYLTLGLKFAQEHAVTSAVYNEETFAVISALVKSSEVIGALNPGEYRFGGTRDFTRTTLVNLANEGGELLDASGKPARFSRFGRLLSLEGFRQALTDPGGLNLYFAYGSNLDQKQMRQRCPEAEVLGTAALKGYQIGFAGHSKQWGGGVATLWPAENKQVEGLLYVVQGSDLMALDRYEGHPVSYRRRQLLVEDFRGAPHPAFVYLKDAPVESVPSAEYFQKVLQAYRGLGFDETPLLEVYKKPR